jgi:hypothetical protein
MTQQNPNARRGRPRLNGTTPVRALRIPDAEWAEIRRKTVANGFTSTAAWIRAVVKLVEI